MRPCGGIQRSTVVQTDGLGPERAAATGRGRVPGRLPTQLEWLPLIAAARRKGAVGGDSPLGLQRQLLWRRRAPLTRGATEVAYQLSPKPLPWRPIGLRMPAPRASRPASTGTGWTRRRQGIGYTFDRDFRVGDQRPGLLEVLVRDRPRPAAHAAATARRIQARAGALANDLALELGDRAEHGKDQTPAGAGRIDVLREDLEADAAPLQVFDRLEQLPARAREPVRFPYHQPVAAAHGLERGIKCRPIALRAARGFREYALAAGVARRPCLAAILADGQQRFPAGLGGRMNRAIAQVTWGRMASALAMARAGGIGQASLLLVERHERGAGLVDEPARLGAHRRLPAGARHDGRLWQAGGRNPADGVRFERSDDALVLRLVHAPWEHGRGVDHDAPCSP